MAKKPKHHAVSHLSLADLRVRANRAAQEGRYQQALELVKQIHKAEPTPANKELLRNTSWDKRGNFGARDTCATP